MLEDQRQWVVGCCKHMNTGGAEGVVASSSKTLQMLLLLSINRAQSLPHFLL